MNQSAPERISVFVDVQNIYYTCRQAYRANFDYNKFWARIDDKHEIVTAVAYATDRGDEKQAQFQNILRAIGFDVRLKPMLQRQDGSTKADWDVGIALDVYEAAQAGDGVVLLSGDGDFAVLLRRIRQRFKTRSQVFSVPELTAVALIAAADQFVAIDESLLLR